MSRLGTMLAALAVAACGARSWFGGGPAIDGGVDGDGDSDSDGDADGDTDADSDGDAEPATCGDGPACGAGAYCCAQERCVASGSCCEHDDCPEGLACLPGQVCGVGDLGCGIEELEVEPRPANLVVLLDRSDSMENEIRGGRKWDIAVEALHEILPEYEGRVRFGLMLFPGAGRSCTAGTIDVEVAEVNAEPILTVLDAQGSLEGFGTTPIADSLAALGGYEGLNDPAYANFVLLLSDGTETCLGRPVEQAEELYASDPRVQIYVVGFGAQVDGFMLSSIAEASHTVRGPRESYWTAEDGDELSQAFDSILASVIQCELDLETEPVDPDEVYLFLDESPLARDGEHEDGWDLDEDANRVTFYGSACDEVRTDRHRIRVVFGCP